MKESLIIRRPLMIPIIVFLAQSALIASLLGAQEKTDSFADTGRPRVVAFHKKMLVETEMKDAKSAIDYWLKILVRGDNAEVDGYIYENLDSLRNDFKKGLIDWTILAPDDYLEIEDDIEFVLGPSPVIGGKITRKYLLLVRSDARISDIGDLRKKKFALTLGNTSVTIFLNTLLWQKKLQEIDEFCQNVMDKRTYAQAILAVFFGQADACVAPERAFDTIAELNPQLRNQLEVIAESQELLQAVSLFRKNLDEKIRKEIETGLNNLDKTTEGRQVMMLFRIEGMVPVRDSSLDSFRQFYQNYLRLRTESLKSKPISERKPDIH